MLCKSSYRNSNDHSGHEPNTSGPAGVSQQCYHRFVNAARVEETFLVGNKYLYSNYISVDVIEKRDKLMIPEIFIVVK